MQYIDCQIHRTLKGNAVLKQKSLNIYNKIGVQTTKYWCSVGITIFSFFVSSNENLPNFIITPTQRQLRVKPLISKRRYIFTADVTKDMIQRNLPLAGFTAPLIIYDHLIFFFGSIAYSFLPDHTVWPFISGDRIKRP